MYDFHQTTRALSLRFKPRSYCQAVRKIILASTVQNSAKFLAGLGWILTLSGYIVILGEAVVCKGLTESMFEIVFF